MTQVNEVADGIYRICTFNLGKQLQFNQFLIDDELPALIHASTYPMYEDVRKAVAKVLDQNAWHMSFAHTLRLMNVAVWDDSSQRYQKRR